MTLPEPPLPTVGQLGRAMFPVSLTEYDRRAFWYATASEALAAAIQACGPATVWFPAYFCNEALRFVRWLPVDLRFYDVQPDLSPGWDSLDRLIVKQGSSHLVVLVHYFGFPNHAESAAAFCKERSMVLVEDAAHALARTPGIGYGSATIFSPRKLFAVPRGGLLLANECTAKSLPRPTMTDSSGIVSWGVRRLVQRALTVAGVPWHFLNAYRHPPVAESEIPKHSGFTACSPYIQRLASVAEQDSRRVIERRRAHYLRLLECCDHLDKFRPMFPHLPDGVCPYGFPLQIKNDAQHWVDVLRSKGVPASRWPDLPPEVQDSSLFPESVRLASQTVLLPVHQSLTRAQVERTGELLRLRV